jgi:hypothetical protein
MDEVFGDTKHNFGSALLKSLALPFLKQNTVMSFLSQPLN